jgi:molecular chaperone DnaK (HSP70)
MLKRATRCQELCHVHPLTAVAQGAAIHAARLSSCVPIYELQSALLLDVLPYSIGILVSPSSSSSSPLQGGSDFVPVLSQYASVPATGSVRFALANNEQTGVTVPVVECIDEDCRQIEMINTFQFLLHKLPPEDLRTISTRFVEIRIHFTELGQLIVTAIDEHDPEHQRKYNLLGDNTTTSAAPFNAPPLGLVVTAISLAVLYVAVKLAFHEVELKQ